MSPETPKPEQMSLSPEQQAVANLSTVAADVLNAQAVRPQTLENGNQLRKIAVDPHFGPTLSEITTPDGIRHYETTSFFNQSFDRGVITRTWQAGGNSVISTSKMEVAGVTSDDYTEVLDIKRVENDVTYLASKLPEKVTKQKQHFGRILGKIATRR